MAKPKNKQPKPFETGLTVTDENGSQYFVFGKTRIKISETFAASGKTLCNLMEDVILRAAVAQ